MSPKLFHPSDLTNLPHSTQSPITQNENMRRKAIPRTEEQSFKRTRSLVEIQKFAEDEEDEDFSDIFGKEGSIVEKDESDAGSEDGVGALMLHSKISNNSWLGDEDDEEDPFASLEQGFDEMDLQANIARDKHARLCTLIEGLVSSLKVTEENDEIIAEVSGQLVSRLHPNQQSVTLIVSSLTSSLSRMPSLSLSAPMGCFPFWKFSSHAL